MKSTTYVPEVLNLRGKLTNDDLDVIAGKRDQLLGRIQERHGISKDEAEKQFNTWHERTPSNFFKRD